MQYRLLDLTLSLNLLKHHVLLWHHHSIICGSNWCLATACCSLVGCTSCIAELVFMAMFRPIYKNRSVLVSEWISLHQERDFIVIINDTTHMACTGYFYCPWYRTLANYDSVTEKVKWRRELPGPNVFADHVFEKFSLKHFGGRNRFFS